ncbi:hypothetical protein [Phytoactinopolyspora limicola]|uniref:hypothetical protein n=1 Tax=Phytoactinopolyspora limicola TaxID=2715536 RepID=UPI00140A12A6|nr:hypothetical protein [Phytoactinopolyspora limicola]
MQKLVDSLVGDAEDGANITQRQSRVSEHPRCGTMLNSSGTVCPGRGASQVVSLSDVPFDVLRKQGQHVNHDFVREQVKVSGDAGPLMLSCVG